MLSHDNILITADSRVVVPKLAQQISLLVSFGLHNVNKGRVDRRPCSGTPVKTCQKRRPLTRVACTGL